MFIIEFLANHRSHVVGEVIGVESREAAERICRQRDEYGNSVAKVIREEDRKPPVVHMLPVVHSDPATAEEIAANIARWRAANGFAPPVVVVEPAPVPAPAATRPASPQPARRGR